jgi:transcriptional regulator with XRE-family HTH domain
VIRANPPHEWRIVPVDGQRLRQLRAKRGLSQEKLAWETDLAVTTIRRLECGPRSACRAWTLNLIASALGTKPASLAPPLLSASVAELPGGVPKKNVVAIKAANLRRTGRSG